MTKKPLNKNLWTPRGVDDTLDLYATWAATYDEDVQAGGYRTPERIAAAVADLVTIGTPILDYGCGTGLSGAALRRAGLRPIDGVDVSEAMVARAKAKTIYRNLWTKPPGLAPCEPGAYDIIVAAGVISLGAAPPETLDLLITATQPGNHIVLSFNEPTLEDGRYDAHLQSRVADASLRLISRTLGPHLEDSGMQSEVLILQRR